MTAESIRTHVVIPRDVVEAIDRVAGTRRRSEFITEALREKLTRTRQLQALREGFGVLARGDYPEWDTPEKISAWVRSLREEADLASARKARRVSPK